MSSISSGTTSSTGLVHTADTSGDLLIKTGSSATTALTISGSTQAVTLAVPLPASSGGTGVSATGVYGVLITATTVSGASSVDFTSGITSAYDEYEIHFINIVLSTGAGLFFRVSEDGGSSWKSGASDYKYSYFYIGSSGGSAIGASSAGDTKVNLSSDIGTASFMPTGGRMVFQKPAGTSYYKVMATESYSTASDNNIYRTLGAGKYIGTTNAVNGFRLYPSTGTFSGDFKLYGIVKS